MTYRDTLEAKEAEIQALKAEIKELKEKFESKDSDLVDVNAAVVHYIGATSDQKVYIKLRSPKDVTDVFPVCFYPAKKDIAKVLPGTIVRIFFKPEK